MPAIVDEGARCGHVRGSDPKTWLEMPAGPARSGRFPPIRPGPRAWHVDASQGDRSEGPRLAGLRHGGRGCVQVGALDLAHLVGLEHVAFLHVVEAVEEDAALESFLDLARVVLEALQLRDRRVVDHGAIADDPNAGAAAHEPA